MGGKESDKFLALLLGSRLPTALSRTLLGFAHAVFLTHRVDCRGVLIKLPVGDGIDAVLEGDKTELDKRLHGLPEGRDGLLGDCGQHLVGIGNLVAEHEPAAAPALHREGLQAVEDRVNRVRIIHRVDEHGFLRIEELRIVPAPCPLELHRYPSGVFASRSASE